MRSVLFVFKDRLLKSWPELQMRIMQLAREGAPPLLGPVVFHLICKRTDRFRALAPKLGPMTRRIPHHVGRVLASHAALRDFDHIYVEMIAALRRVEGEPHRVDASKKLGTSAP
jgi:hypothetical protein